MAATTLIAFILMFFKIIPVLSHRLINTPDPDRVWDTVVVSSDPITIKEKKDNEVSPLKLKQILKPQKRSFEECPENDFKCLYGNNDEKFDQDQTVNSFIERLPDIRNENLNDENVDEDTTRGVDNSRNSYWSLVDSQRHHHPYDDKKGWVTLDPVPWSTSKISKWHPNKVGIQQESKPWGYGPTTQTPVQQFWVSGLHGQRPGSQWGVGNNDIITDNKPSDFPTNVHNEYGYSQQELSHRPESGYYKYPESHNDLHQKQQYGGGHQPSKYGQNGHPHSYPISGNGEWVLLSTTKGYSTPQRHRWASKFGTSKNIERSFNARNAKPIEISRYHEEDLDDKMHGGKNPTIDRKSDSNEKIVQNLQKSNVTNEADSEATSVRLVYAEPSRNQEPVKSFRRKIRLQVLPAVENSSTSHGGLIEVDSNQQTVDEAQQEDEKMKKLKTIANVKKNKIRGYKLVPVAKVTGKGMTQKNAMTLAAVGAGMIPATMALLVPMALGRKRRSLPGRHVGYEKIFGEDSRVKRW